jgi:glycosyltransferase involved in cell wall biosynthesis
MSPSALPRVSVIMIFWNAARFMNEAIDSVLAQSFEPWELILVDDGSSDASSSIALDYANIHPDKIRYLQHDGRAHKGSSASRNLGMAASRGEYVAFLDADDVYLPDKLAEQVSMLDRMPDVAMLYGRTELWFSWDASAAPPRLDKLTEAAPNLDTQYSPPALATHFLNNEYYYPCTCSTIIRRSAIEAVGGCDERFQSTYEDMVLFVKLCARFPVYVSSKCWDRYRRHPDSTWSKTIQAGKFRHGHPNPVRHEFLKWADEYLRVVNDDSSTLRQAVSEQLRPYDHPISSIPGFFAGVLMRQTRRIAGTISRRLVPSSLRKRMRKRLKPLTKKLFRFGSFRRLEPVSREFGFDRGTPVDRYYIERFLARHSDDIKGRVLEIEEDTYTRRFGKDHVIHSDVLYVTPHCEQATIVADLAQGDNIPSDAFDCIILTQTLQYIYDVDAAIRTVYRILKPGGVVLATLPGISETRTDPSGAAWYWSFTPRSARAVFEEAFPRDRLTIESHGNVLIACAFLQGLAAEELHKHELDHHDLPFVISTTVRAQKPE